MSKKQSKPKHQKDHIEGEKQKAISPLLSVEERKALGKRERSNVPRIAHALWHSPSQGRDVIKILEKSNEGRMEELIPIRYGRMAQSAFAFFRGSAALMAYDLATTPTTSLRTQLCGDCHLMNFGVFATPERRIVLDINDFDETLPGPFEFDLKRLATSFVLAARQNLFKDAVAKRLAIGVVQSYRKSMKEFAQMRVLDIHYAKFDIDSFAQTVRDPLWKERADRTLKRAQKQTVPDHYYPKMTHSINGRTLIKDNPPLIFHSDEEAQADFAESIVEVTRSYIATLQDDRKSLLDKFRVQDVAHKVVGVGSVGTRCGIALLTASENDPLILQYKEARESVLEQFCGKSQYSNHAERVVNGQRLMQASSDIFLGWTTGLKGFHFYIRQLRDAKFSLRPEIWDASQMMEVAKLVGWILARAHARSGDPVVLSAYMGNSDELDLALASFAMAYADQTRADYDVLREAINNEKVKAYFER